MKTFFAVLGAILAAGVIFLIGNSMVAHFREWESRKDELIDVIEKDRSDLAEINSRFYTESAEQMHDNIRMINQLDSIQRKAYESLQYILSHKPFFPLNEEEQKWLAKARREVGADKSAPTSPTSEETKTPLPEYVTLNMEASVYDENKNEIRIPAGTKLKLLSHSEHDITFRYNNGTYSLPAAITDFKKY
jgi:hypothetical protein